MKHERLGDSVSKQVADGDVDHKSERAAQHVALVLERVVLVEEVTQDTSYNVIGSRGHPVGASEQIVQPEHDAAADDRVDDADDDELSKFSIYVLDCHNLLTVSRVSLAPVPLAPAFVALARLQAFAIQLCIALIILYCRRDFNHYRSNL